MVPWCSAVRCTEHPTRALCMVHTQARLQGTLAVRCAVLCAKCVQSTAQYSAGLPSMATAKEPRETRVAVGLLSACILPLAEKKAATARERGEREHTAE